MARDYVKKAKPEQGSGKAIKLLIFTIILVVFFVLGLVYLKNHPMTSTTKQQPSPEQKKLEIKSKKRAHKEPRFEFYTMLPKGARSTEKNTTALESPVPASESKTDKAPDANPKEVAAKTETTTPANIKYIIQVAAYRNYSDADRLKAELILLGYQAKIEKIQNPNGTWHRVRLGPYATQEAAAQDRAKLSKINLKSIVRKAG
ncbi:MAG: SPOR domain-containing protein [Proteobacteria bacterium]|nr:SPOR domain-containing protein [Pseudomonadota bacterium]